MRVYKRMPKARKAASPVVRTTIEFPPALWRAAKIRAMDDGTDLRSVVMTALRAYLATPRTGGR
jgi:hypothetical protein